MISKKMAKALNDQVKMKFFLHTFIFLCLHGLQLRG